MKDAEIIQQIRSGRPDAPIKLLYKEFPKVCGLIIASGGDETEARATFHDALILMMEKVQDPAFVLTCKLTTYLFGVNRLLWKNKLRKLNRTHEVEWSDTLILTNEDLGIDDGQEALIAAMETVLMRISDRCREILQRFYFKSETMADIATAMGFMSVNSAKTQKYKCMEQAIRLASDINLQNA